MSQKESEYLVIGDIHGCYDELEDLVIKSGKGYISEETGRLTLYPESQVILVGDLCAQGPKPQEVIDFV